MSIRVYSKKPCVQCDATLRYVEDAAKRLPEGAIDLTVIEEGARRPDILEIAANAKPPIRSAPIVIATYPDGSRRMWGGFRPDELDAYFAAVA